MDVRLQRRRVHPQLFAFEPLLVPCKADNDLVHFFPGARLDHIRQGRILAVGDNGIIIKAAEKAQHL
jgi:hypothetical protein